MSSIDIATHDVQDSVHIVTHDVQDSLHCNQGQIQDLIWGPQIVTGLNCRWCTAALCKQSEPFSAWGPGPILGPHKLLGISLLNMHSLHLGVPFYTIIEIIKY